jgi:hypothetical protein
MQEDDYLQAWKAATSGAWQIKTITMINCTYVGKHSRADGRRGGGFWA